MIKTTHTQGVRAFVPMNHIGAPIVAFAPDAEAGTPEESTAPLSLADAVAAYTSTPTEDGADTGQPDPDDAPEGDIADEELPEEIPEGEDEEGDPDDEGQAEETDESDDAAGLFVSPKGKVKLPDGTFSTVDDLIKGNLRDRDYRQKTMELAEARKALEPQSQAVKQKETQLSEQAEYMASLIKSIVPEAPDPALLSTDPVAYMQQEAQHKQWMQHLSYIQQQQQQAKTAGQAETATKQKESAEREWNALLEAVPDLKDAKRLNSFAGDIKTHGHAYGFTPEEIAAVAMDHRQALVLKDAIAWRKLQANKGKVAAKVEGRPPVQRAGTRLAPGQQKARQTRAAMDRLNNSGSLADGVAALLAIEQG